MLCKGWYILGKDQFDEAFAHCSTFFLQFVPQVWSRDGCLRWNTSSNLPLVSALHRMGPNLPEVLLVQPEGQCCPGTWADQCHKLGRRRGAADNNKLQTEVNRRALYRFSNDLDSWVCCSTCLLLLDVIIVVSHMSCGLWMRLYCVMIIVVVHRCYVRYPV